jgi:hypothetical protein
MRVLRLAADLERQPWAVQVKAIPTASVPVVKVLADPSRLSGAISGNGEWLLYQQSITAASAVAAGGMIPMHQQHYENINFATVESGLSRYSKCYAYQISENAATVARSRCYEWSHIC